MLLQVGGALLAEGSSSATLSNVAFTSNQAGVYGGALSFYEESVCLMNASHVGANTATFGGGGMFLSAATGELDGVAFVGNSVSGGRCVCVVCCWWCFVAGGGCDGA